MRTFAYKAYTRAGRRRRGVLVADSERHAAEILKAQGLFAENILSRGAASKADSGGGRGSRLGVGWRRQRLDRDLRAVFTRQMAVLLAADLSAEAALDAVRMSGTAPAIEALSAEAKAALLDGQPLSAALARADPGMPRYYVAALSAGESAGGLAAVFEELAEHLETRGTDRARLATALVYPAFVATVSLIVSGVLMTTVAPEIVAMYEASGRDLPRLTRIMLAISDWIGSSWPALLAAGSALAGAFALALRRPGIRERWDALVIRMPVIGRLIRLDAAAQYLRSLALVVGSHQPVPEAAESAAAVLTLRRFRREAEAACTAVRRGESLATALTEVSVIPPVARQLVATGESSARLGRMTDRAAVLVETWLGNERRRLAALLDPILMMLVGAMVLVIVMSILLPIFDLQSAVGPG